MSQLSVAGRALRMLPVEVPGTHISTVWSSSTLGSYMGRGGHMGITNNGTDTLHVWIGSISTLEFAGSVGTHENPSLLDVTDIHQPPVNLAGSQQALVQDPYGRYQVKEGLVNVPYSDGPLWNTAQLGYAREFIRKFGTAVPVGALYEPLVPPISTIYLVSASDGTRAVGNILT